MPNGNKTIPARSFILLILLVCGLTLSAQKKDSIHINADYPSFNIDNECKSKSQRTAKPTTIKITRQKLAEIKTVKDLLKDIPVKCEVQCVFVSIKKPDDKVFEFINVGNEMVYADRLIIAKYIVIENLVTSCPTLHKANYKLIIE